jgi:hypothetical protein
LSLARLFDFFEIPRNRYDQAENADATPEMARGTAIIFEPQSS